MYCLIPLLLASVADASYVITVFGDVLEDKEFFTKTYPWIIDNIGGHVSVEYHLLGSGRYSVPQMCALAQLSRNTYLQAEYLKCEAEGTRPQKCLCRSGIDAELFRRCVLERGGKAGVAAAKYTALGIDASPIIEMWPRSTAFELTDSGYLKKICSMFNDDDKPRSCEKPIGCDNSTTFVERRAIAQFNCFYRDDNDEDITTSTTESTTIFPMTKETSRFTVNQDYYDYYTRYNV